MLEAQTRKRLRRTDRLGIRFGPEGRLRSVSVTCATFSGNPLLLGYPRAGLQSAWSTSRFIQLRGGHKGGSSFLGLGTSGVGVWSHCEAVEASDAARVLMRFAPRWHKLTTALSPAGVASCAVGESGRDADGHQGVQPNAQVLHRPSHPPCRWPIQRCDSRARARRAILALCSPADLLCARAGASRHREPCTPRHTTSARSEL